MIPGFAAPWMLWGALLVSVPVLIHILNRRRFVVQPFAAMRFLLLAYQQRRRRLRLESLLLLLLRCLAVLVAALAMALPFVGSDSPLAMMASGPRDLVLILDRSGSMDLTTGGVSADDRVLEAVRRRLRQLSDERGDAVTLVTMGSGPRLAAPIGSSPSQALAALERDPQPPGGVADPVAAVRYVAEVVRAARPGRLDVEVFSDLQRVSWGSIGPSLGAMFATILERGGGRLRIVPVGAEGGAGGDPVNLGVLSLSADEPLVLAGEPAGYTVVVQNHGDVSRNGVGGAFLLDGELRQRVTLDLPPRQQVAATTRLRIDSPGSHHVSFVLDGDDLPFDDARTLALDVRASIDVLLVDGAPTPGDPLRGATGYLALALDPGNLERGLRFRPEVRDLGAFEQSLSDLGRFDAIVLADVGGMTAAAATALADTVRAGTPLLVFLGDRVEPTLYNERLGGLGLLPARLGPALGDPGGRAGEDYVTLVLADPPPPALALFGDPRLAVLLQVPVLAWRDLTPAPESRVLASFVDALGHTRPAIVEGALERGRVLLVATSADDSWSLLPRHPATWVPLVHELLASLTAADPSVTNVPVGDAPTLAVRGVPLSARLTLPSGAMLDVGRPEFTRVADRSLLVLDATPLDEAGAYRLEVETATETTQLALAALPEAREGDLSRIDTSALEQALGEVPFVLGEQSEDVELESADAGDGNLAQVLLWTLLILLLGESFLARWMGRAR